MVVSRQGDLIQMMDAGSAEGMIWENEVRQAIVVYSHAVQYPWMSAAAREEERSGASS